MSKESIRVSLPWVALAFSIISALVAADLWKGRVLYASRADFDSLRFEVKTVSAKQDNLNNGQDDLKAMVKALLLQELESDHRAPPAAHRRGQ